MHAERGLQKAGEIAKDEFDTDAVKPGNSGASGELDSPSGSPSDAMAPSAVTTGGDRR